MSSISKLASTVAAVAFAVSAGQAIAAEAKLPSTIAWTAYGVGSAGYNQAVAIGNALKSKMGVSLRVQPGKNDVSRLVPVRDGKVPFSANGVGTYLSQEGVFDFAAPDWGPQEVRVLMMNNGDVNLIVGVAKEAGIETYKDLKGKRVAWVIGGSALNHNITAILAFAGLTWNDVKRVDFPGFGASWDGLVNGQVDAAFASTNSGMAIRAENAPRGLHWPPMPAEDKEGWARVKAIAPYMSPHVATIGAGGISKENPHKGAAYPYPILIAYAGQDADLVYNMTKAVEELYDVYKDGAPGIAGWKLDQQIFDWAVPYHEGAIRYFKEKGVWTDAHQKHNDALVKRQTVLKAAWKEHAAKKIEDKEKAEAAWLKTRAAALEKAGMAVIFEGS